ncbi:MAG: protein kinase [Polyangiaceae bacterium]|nr:protein kinase [Polyangiaceae bacterium]
MDPWSEWEDRDEHDGFRPGDPVGPFELLFPSASGGMATVWTARRRGARGGDHVVAVKLLSDALQHEDEARAMFLDEARTASRILHPNVVEIFACGEVRQRPYIAMEWIDGDSLAKIAAVQKQRGALLPLAWVLHVASAACAGLHAAHEVRDDAGELLNLIHRDVTPQNVMVGFDGTVKVVDFGVAKSRAQTQVSRAGALKGKTAYFSPEQVTGETIDRRSDLFSMGCLLYLLVTGHPPFRGRGMVEIINQIANRVPQRPLEIMPELHPDLDRIIMRALAKDPAERFQTAAEIRRDIEKVRAELGNPMGGKEVGALVARLFPGVTEERKARVASAAAELDERQGGGPHSDPRPMRPEDATEVMMRNVALLLGGAPESVGRKSEPAGRRADSVGRRADSVGRRSEPAGRKSEPAGRKSDPGGRKSDPNRRKSDPEAWHSQPEDGGPMSVRMGAAAVAWREPGGIAAPAPVEPSAEAAASTKRHGAARRPPVVWLALAVGIAIGIALAVVLSRLG